MFIGHYAPALLVKAKRPELPLWILFIAAQLVDIGWSILVLLRVEKVRLIEDFTGSNSLDLFFMPYTHSLTSALVWSFGAMVLHRCIFSARAWTSAILFGLVVLSHWFLDLIVHVPDLPLYGNSHKVGFSLWNSPILSMSLELGVCLVSLFALRRRSLVSGWRVITLALVLVSSQFFGHLGPLPKSPELMAMTALFSYLFFAGLAYKLVDE